MEGTGFSRKKGVTFASTCFNGINALSGVGILSVPYALAHGGWLSLPLLLIVAGVCYYTGVLLRRCQDSNDLVNTYPDIGQLAFGRKGRIVVSIFMNLELYLAAIGFLIMDGDNLEKLFPGAAIHLPCLPPVDRKRAFILLATAIVLPTTWSRSLGALSYVSFGGVVASVVLLACVLWLGTVGGVGFREGGELVRWSGLPTAASIFLFCYGGHAVFPTLYTSMEDRHQFSRVLQISFFVCTLSYGSMAVAGYLMYGTAAMSQITLNLPGEKLGSRLAIYTTVVNPLAKYALMISPVATAIEECFESARFRSVRVLLRTMLVLSTAVIALTLPFFGYLVTLTGALLSTTASVLLPCLCYLKIFKDARRRRVESAILGAIMAAGLSIATVGTYCSVRQIATSL